MVEPNVRKKCFIIMPITTPEALVREYNGDPDHFTHVLDCLFSPAIEKAGFDPIPPKSKGSDIIQAEIIKHLASGELVLCDMSILNPNVFFEFGIRTALDKPVALVVDDKTEPVPFDTSIINFHKYSSSLDAWTIDEEIGALANHIVSAYEKTEDRNALWKYFGVAQTGVFRPEEALLGEKIDLVMKEVAALKSELRETGKPGQASQRMSNLSNFLLSVDRAEKETEFRNFLIHSLRTEPPDPKSRKYSELRTGSLKDITEEVKEEPNHDSQQPDSPQEKFKK